MNNPFSLEGKTILVTGASAGIGRAIATICAGMGANVVITARNLARLEETMSLLEGQGHVLLTADLTEASERESLVKAMPLVDGVVHCAGVGQRVPCKQIEQTDLDMVLQSNLEAPILLQAELLREKKLKKGTSIVFIASAAASMPSVGNAAYSASKGAIISYAKCLAEELASRRIRVNCVSPAMVWTSLSLVGATQEQLEIAQQSYPLGRYGRPEDVANLVVYLLSNASEWMTGSNIEITGGTQKL